MNALESYRQAQMRAKESSRRVFGDGEELRETWAVGGTGKNRDVDPKEFARYLMSIGYTGVHIDSGSAMKDGSSSVSGIPPEEAEE